MEEENKNILGDFIEKNPTTSIYGGLGLLGGLLSKKIPGSKFLGNALKNLNISPQFKGFIGAPVEKTKRMGESFKNILKPGAGKQARKFLTRTVAPRVFAPIATFEIGSELGKNYITPYLNKGVDAAFDAAAPKAFSEEEMAEIKKRGAELEAAYLSDYGVDMPAQTSNKQMDQPPPLVSGSLSENPLGSDIVMTMGGGDGGPITAETQAGNQFEITQDQLDALNRQDELAGVPEFFSEAGEGRINLGSINPRFEGQFGDARTQAILRGEGPTSEGTMDMQQRLQDQYQENLNQQAIQEQADRNYEAFLRSDISPTQPLSPEITQGPRPTQGPSATAGLPPSTFNETFRPGESPYAIQGTGSSFNQTFRPGESPNAIQGGVSNSPDVLMDGTTFKDYAKGLRVQYETQGKKLSNVDAKRLARIEFNKLKSAELQNQQQLQLQRDRLDLQRQQGQQGPKTSMFELELISEGANLYEKSQSGKLNQEDQNRLNTIVAFINRGSDGIGDIKSADEIFGTSVPEPTERFEFSSSDIILY